jgi:hypothetical protein
VGASLMAGTRSVAGRDLRSRCEICHKTLGEALLGGGSSDHLHHFPETHFWDEEQALAAERLLGAIIATESSAQVLTEALRSMIEARFLILDPDSNPTAAIAVLDQGIAQARDALNLSDEPEPTDPLDKL